MISSSRFLVLSSLFVAAAACGGTSDAPPGTKSAGDVQAEGMAQTFAGQNKCNPKNHERPFVIEWDATDMSSFEARAANDVVFVRYHGCNLEVIDGCVDDSVAGAYGAYRPVEWTSGSVEVMEIENEGELYTKLPLGAASLGGRVHGGEKFHMEYFVSGTRTATRDAIQRADLKPPACKGATHFVYAYNLGAFALGSRSNIEAEAGATVWGASAGGGTKSKSKAEKRGGELGRCRAESAKETQACRVPIRLTLRELGGGESGESKDARAPETPEAASIAARLQANTAKEKQAEEHANTAATKLSSRDGKGCIAELDLHDKLDPRPSGVSTNPGAFLAASRARCLMVAGQCSPGKDLYRKHLEKTSAATLGPQQIDTKTDEAATQYCQGGAGAMSPRDQYLKAGADLEVAAYKERKDAAFCMSTYATAKKLVATVKPKDEDDPVKFVFANVRTNAPLCLVRANDCKGAWTVYKEAWKLDPLMPEDSRKLNEGGLRAGFDAITGEKCKGK